MCPVRTLAWKLVLGGAALAGCRGPGALSAPGRLGPEAATAHPAEVHSNITRADYAGSAACAPCHAGEYALWLASPMHRMTRDLAHTSIAAPFAGATFAF